jgi:probable F420-dependent oxidoreductase
MKIGFQLPNVGPVGSADAIAKVARRAEELGYHSLWTTDRLLWPVQPQTPYPPTPDGSLPEQYKRVLDPLDTLTYAAAHTKTVMLGTSVLDIPYYNPLTLARRITTIDQLSAGRLRVGLGLGWSQDEMEATGADINKRGAVADEFLGALKAIWTSDPVEFRGKFYRIAKSYISHKPVQKPHPPIILAAFAPAALKRLALLADGWNPVGIPVEGMAQMFAGIKQMAEKAGRDPQRLQLIVRANPTITDQPLGANRAIFTGTLRQIGEDTQACAGIGAHELFFDPTFYTQSLPRWLELMEQCRGWVS